MFQLGKTIISEDILDKQFVCNIDACKGECCVAGEAGAPVTEEETAILKSIYPLIKGFLRQVGNDAIEKEGVFTTNPIGDFETTLVNGKECAYAVFDNKGVAGCAIEQAYNQGVVSFQKPISCHLYPIRIQEYKTLTAINYHSWPICNDACTLGKKLKTPTYQFAKTALIRKFGKDWYDELNQVAEEYYNNKSKISGN